jgi:hypothetical protein
VVRRAACSCGKLAVTVEGEPVRVSVCHCLACQRRTGSVFGAQARFETARAQVTGDSTVYVRVAEDGEKIFVHFCPACGATVYYRMETTPELTAIPVGAFAEPGFPAPRFSVYEDRKHAWVAIPGELEHWG